MFIRILRPGNHYDYIKDFMLDSLIESEDVVKFKRSTGWVTVGSEPIRKNRRDRVFVGSDRRTVYEPIIIQKYRRMVGDHAPLSSLDSAQPET